MERLPYLLTVILTVLILLLMNSISQAQTSFNISNQTTGDTLFTIDNEGKVGIVIYRPSNGLDIIAKNGILLCKKRLNNGSDSCLKSLSGCICSDH